MNSNIDEILETLAIECWKTGYHKKVLSIKDGDVVNYGALFIPAKQAIQQELLKARIDELENMPRADTTVDEYFDNRIANLQAKLKENSDE